MNNPAALVCVVCGIMFLMAGRVAATHDLPVADVAYALAVIYTAIGLWIAITGRGRRD